MPCERETTGALKDKWGYRVWQSEPQMQCHRQEGWRRARQHQTLPHETPAQIKKSKICTHPNKCTHKCPMHHQHSDTDYEQQGHYRGHLNSGLREQMPSGHKFLPNALCVQKNTNRHNNHTHINNHTQSKIPKTNTHKYDI